LQLRAAAEVAIPAACSEQAAQLQLVSGRRNIPAAMAAI
jgi:hypothetical protein